MPSQATEPRLHQRGSDVQGLPEVRAAVSVLAGNHEAGFGAAQQDKQRSAGKLKYWDGRWASVGMMRNGRAASGVSSPPVSRSRHADRGTPTRGPGNRSNVKGLELFQLGRRQDVTIAGPPDVEGREQEDADDEVGEEAAYDDDGERALGIGTDGMRDRGW